MKQITTSLGVGAVFTALTSLLIWAQGGLGSTTQGKPFTHLHCPECGLETRFEPARQGSTCPQCGPTGAKLIATVGLNKERAAEIGLTGRVLVAGIVSFVVTAGLLYGWTLRRRQRRQTDAAARRKPVLCHCPFCRRKLGFPPAKIGAGVTCPRCKTAFVLSPHEIIQELSSP